MRKIAIIFSILMLACTVLPADSITTGIGLHPNLKIIGVEGCDIVYKKRGARKAQYKPLANVEMIEIAGESAFNKAEKLASKKKWSSARKKYGIALKKTRKPWIKQLIVIRRLGVMDNSENIDSAVREWFKIVSKNKYSKTSLALCPSHPGAKGSAKNTRAIKLLKDKLSQVKGQKPYAGKIKGLLMLLYRREGHKTMAARIISGVGPTASGSDQATSSGKQSIDTLQVIYDGGNIEDIKQALSGISSNLHKYIRRELPKLLLLRGKMRMKLSASAVGDKKRRLLLGAGQDLMWVVAAFPASAQAPEALYQAGTMHTLLDRKNLDAARAAYKAVTEDYKNSPFAAKAAKALKEK